MLLLVGFNAWYDFCFKGTAFYILLGMYQMIHLTMSKVL